MTDSDIDSQVPTVLPVLRKYYYKLRLFFDPVATMTMLHDRVGEIADLSDSKRSLIFAFGSQNNRHVLSDQKLFLNLEQLPISFQTPGSSVERLTSGLIFMNGEKHRQHRRLLMSSFHRNQMPDYAKDIAETTRVFLQTLNVGDRIDLSKQMQILSAKITSKILLGIDVASDLDSFTSDIHNLITGLYSIPVLFLPPKLSRRHREVLDLARQLELTARSLIAKKREQDDQVDAFAKLVKANVQSNVIGDSELVGHLTVLFVAGYASTFSNLTWILLLLAQHPQVLASLYEEIRHECKGDDPTLAHLDNLDLLDRVIKESMRLIPTTPYIARKTACHTTLFNYSIPANSVVVVSPYVTHHDPKIYSDPQCFKPERWEHMTPDVYEYLPFGAGPRMCMGSALGIMQLKIMLSIILQRFWFELVSGIKVDRAVKVTMMPAPRVPVEVKAVGSKIRRQRIRGQIHEMVRL